MIDAILMTFRRSTLAFVTTALLFGASAGYSDSPVRAVPNFNLVDLQGKNHELRRAEGKAVVLFFTGNGCPIARKSVEKLKSLRERFGSDIAFWLINTYAADSRKECRKEYDDFHMRPLTYLRDPRQELALVLGVERTAEVVAIGTETWRVFYQGAIDDQFTEGAQRPAPEQKFLENALTQFTSGQLVAINRTQSRGCRINFAFDPPDLANLYACRVAPLLQSHCVECHQAGGIGPWAMDFTNMCVIIRE
jgi:hypothetical protein